MKREDLIFFIFYFSFRINRYYSIQIKNVDFCFPLQYILNTKYESYLKLKILYYFIIFEVCFFN
jgi:hypothetical protein